VAVPFFAVMNPYRLYHLAFFTLAPFSVIGAIFVFNLLKKVRIIGVDYNKAVKFLAVFLIIFMLLNTKFINEMVNQPTYSRYLSENTILNQKYIDINETGGFCAGIITTYDVSSSKWISKYKNKNKNIYAYNGFGEAPINAYGGIPLEGLDRDIHKAIDKKDYIQILYLFAKYKIWYKKDILGNFIYYNASSLYNDIYKKCSKVYDNGGSQIFVSNLR
jgi:uncharacterized membrane protein